MRHIQEIGLQNLRLAVHRQFFLPFCSRKCAGHLIPYLCATKGVSDRVLSFYSMVMERPGRKDLPQCEPTTEAWEPSSSHLSLHGLLTSPVGQHVHCPQLCLLQATRQSQLPRKKIILDSRLLCLLELSCWLGRKASLSILRDHTRCGSVTSEAAHTSQRCLMRVDAAGLPAPVPMPPVFTGTFRGEVDGLKVRKAALELTILTLERKE